MIEPNLRRLLISLGSFLVGWAVAELTTRQPKGGVVEECCDLPPLGWYCTREKGHDGPCAAHIGTWRG